MIFRPTLPLTRGDAATRTGLYHPRNEDQFRILDVSHPVVRRQRRGCLYVVSDGVSTTPRGRQAAELTCARVEGFFDRFAKPRIQSLVQIVSEIDWELRETGVGQAACTVSLLWLAAGMANVVHVGDSEVYRVRHGKATRVTRMHRGGRALGAYVGMGPTVADVIQIWQEPLFVGDLYLLVTDGVTAVVPPDELLDAWWAQGGSAERAAHAIIAEVERRGGHDDATALVVDVLALEENPADEEPSPVPAGARQA